MYLKYGGPPADGGHPGGRRTGGHPGGRRTGGRYTTGGHTLYAYAMGEGRIRREPRRGGSIIILYMCSMYISDIDRRSTPFYQPDIFIELRSNQVNILTPEFMININITHLRIKLLPLTKGHGRYKAATPERTLLSVGEWRLHVQ
jgi:hypothetical protein